MSDEVFQDENDDLLKDLEDDMRDESSDELTGEDDDTSDNDNVNAESESCTDKLLQIVGICKVLNLKEFEDDGIGAEIPITRLCDSFLKIIVSESLELKDCLTPINQFMSLIDEQFETLYTYLKLIYKSKFPDLEFLVHTPLQFVKVIEILNKHVVNTDFSQQDLTSKFAKIADLSKEDILILMMSLNSNFNATYVFAPNTQKNLTNGIRMIEILNNTRSRLFAYTSSMIFEIAPNLCALIGPEIASQLIAHTGDIKKLSQVPSCNLASIGKKKELSHQLKTNESGVRQEGYIYSSDLIQKQPVETHKQILRVLCAKVALAVRVDAGQTKSPTLGEKWKNELLAKIAKIVEPPIVDYVKPLPVPTDQTKKKRAGRKFRKYKEQFQLSHLRQLQNRMEFGKQEETVLNGFGEEVGLGMTNNSLRQANGITTRITKKANNTAKLTKTLRKRVAQANEQANEFSLTLNASNDKLFK